VPNSLPPTLPARGLPNGLPRPASMQNRGNTLTNANSRDDSSGTRRLLDHYDFYRTPDNMKVRLGGGNYATVWKGVSRSTGEEVAFKIIVKNDVTVAEANPMHAELLKMVDHKNIIQLKDYFDEQKALCLVLELATGGDIVERVHSSGVFTEAAAVRYSRQILSGALALAHSHKRGLLYIYTSTSTSIKYLCAYVALAHCHKRGLVPCDIKCLNLCHTTTALLMLCYCFAHALLQRWRTATSGVWCTATLSARTSSSPAARQTLSSRLQTSVLLSCCSEATN
jgi:hypothetical protein